MRTSLPRYREEHGGVVTRRVPHLVQLYARCRDLRRARSDARFSEPHGCGHRYVRYEFAIFVVQAFLWLVSVVMRPCVPRLMMEIALRNGHPLGGALASIATPSVV